MARADIISPEMVRKLIEYDPQTGKMIWRHRPASLCVSEGHCRRWNDRYAGTPALNSPTTGGYLRGAIFGIGCFAHRAAYAIQHGDWPLYVDHINGNKADNRADNLRDATKVMNGRNMLISKRNKSGRTGVFWREKYGRWTVSIGIEGKVKYVGCFRRKADAIAAREEAERKYGFHPNHGNSPEIDNGFE